MQAQKIEKCYDVRKVPSGEAGEHQRASFFNLGGESLVPGGGGAIAASLPHGGDPGFDLLGWKVLISPPPLGQLRISRTVQINCSN